MALNNYITIFLCLALVIVSTSEAQACGCDDNRSWNEVAQSDAIFIGEVVEIKLEYLIENAPWLYVPETLFPDLYPNSVKIVIEVERWWGGSGYQLVEVFTDRSSCGLEPPRLGSTVLIEAAWHRGRLFTDLCLRSLPIYSGGEVQSLASDTSYAGYRLLTRDSLYAHLGQGHEPSKIKYKWFIFVLIGISVIVWWRWFRAA